ncbi:ATP-binding protein [Isoptericola sp. NPDC019693]|uniref:ATP-binding protein n=1 Tax=Isoptericola sp. NPDC019693 TaxID=3364009 RepID=UPI0037A54943
MDDAATPSGTSTVPMAPPRPGYAPVAEWVLADAEQLSRLRSSLARIVGPADAAASGMHDTAEKLVLIASELATNALLHGRPPTVVRLLRNDSSWLLDVVDHDVEGVPVLDGGRPPGHGGLGLLIAERLSAQVGWYTSGTAKHVWATFPVTQSD